MISTELRLIAAHLEGLEESIIHRLLDRAQFATNEIVYRAGQSGFEGEKGQSLFELRLRYQEQMDAEFGRFMVPEERPFHRDLPRPRRSIEMASSPLSREASAAVNRTESIVSRYLAYVPVIASGGDDGQYGSSVEHDVLAIQAIGRRVHYGALYVAESKYLDNPKAISEAAGKAASGDTQPLLALITRPEVEQRILARIGEKVTYIQASVNPEVRRRVDNEAVLQLYRDTIIPETKQGEIDYLVARQESHRLSSKT